MTRDVEMALRECRQLCDGLAEALGRAERALASASQEPVQSPVQTALEDLPEPCPHRRAHRPGRPSKIDTDPELRAFITARIDRLTFVQLAEEIARTFPPDRRIGKSGIHAWWRKSHPR